MEKRPGSLSRAVQRERSVVTGALGQDLDARVVLAVGIGQVAARLTELFLAACPRLAELAIDLGFREAGEMRVTDGMRADLEASVRERAELGPVHRLELVGKSNRVRCELGNVERTALVGKGRRSKDRGRHPQALEQVQGPRDARVRVVEGHVQEAAAPSIASLAPTGWNPRSSRLCT